MKGIHVSSSLVIPEAELTATFSTSGGPGGQHANRSSTRVEIAWNVDESGVLSANQRRLIRSRLASRIDKEGTLRIASSATRSQHRNRIDAEQRLAKLVAGALRTRRSRIRTTPSRAANQKRLDEKRRRAEIKRARQKPEP